MILDCNEIIPQRLWVGSYPQEADLMRFRQMDITSVVSLQDETDITHRGISLEKLGRAYAEAGIEFRQAPVHDFDKAELLAKLPCCVAVIEAALAPRSARVYLHCTMGMNRAPTAAAAYMIRALGMTASQAYDHIVSRRYCQPYLDVLEDYAASLGDPTRREEPK